MKSSHLHSVHADQTAAHGSVRGYTSDCCCRSR